MYEILEAVDRCCGFIRWGFRKAFRIQKPEDIRPLARAQDIAYGAVVVVAIIGILIGMAAILVNR